MKIFNVIYGIWFIQYSVKFKFDYPSKIIRIENTTHNCNKEIYTFKFVYLRNKNIGVLNRSIIKDMIFDRFIVGVD